MPIRLRAALAALLLALSARAQTGRRPAGLPASPGVVPPPVQYPFKTASFLATVSAEGRPTVGARFWISPDGSLQEIRKPDGITHQLRARGQVFLWDEKTGRGLRGADAGTPRASGIPDALDVLRELPVDIRSDHVLRSKRETVQGSRTRRFDFAWQDARLLGARHEGSIWLLEDRDFPVKFAESAPGPKVEIVFSDLRFDADIPSAYFATPQDIRFTDLLTGRVAPSR